MKLTPGQMQNLAHKVLDHWKKQNQVTFKVDEKVVLEKILQVIRGELQKEADLEKDVHKMLDQLERTNAGQFERYKMYPLIKKQLAKEKKVIL